MLLGLKLFCLKPNEHHLKILCKYLLAEEFSILVRRNQMLFMEWVIYVILITLLACIASISVGLSTSSKHFSNM